jgi:hypothetical protein
MAFLPSVVQIDFGHGCPVPIHSGRGRRAGRRAPVSAGQYAPRPLSLCRIGHAWRDIQRGLCLLHIRGGCPIGPPLPRRSGRRRHRSGPSVGDADRAPCPKRRAGSRQRSRHAPCAPVESLVRPVPSAASTSPLTGRPHLSAVDRASGVGSIGRPSQGPCVSRNGSHVFEGRVSAPLIYPSCPPWTLGGRSRVPTGAIRGRIVP